MNGKRWTGWIAAAGAVVAALWLGIAHAEAPQSFSAAFSASHPPRSGNPVSDPHLQYQRITRHPREGGGPRFIPEPVSHG